MYNNTILNRSLNAITGPVDFTRTRMTVALIYNITAV